MREGERERRESEGEGDSWRTRGGVKGRKGGRGRQLDDERGRERKRGKGERGRRK